MAIKDGFILTRPSELGRIAIGKRNNKGYPVKLDHFIFTLPQANDNGAYEIDEKITKIHEEAMGTPVREIPIILPFETPDEVFYTSYADYKRRGVCDCYGNGITAKRNIGGEWTDVECGYRDCDFKIWKRPGKADIISCKPRGILSVWLPLVDKIGGVYKFRTSSKNTIGSITSTLEQFYKLRGTLVGLVAKMVVFPKMVKTDEKSGSTQKIYVVRIEYEGSMDEMIRSIGAFGQKPAPKEIEGCVEDISTPDFDPIINEDGDEPIDEPADEVVQDREEDYGDDSDF